MELPNLKLSDVHCVLLVTPPGPSARAHSPGATAAAACDGAASPRAAPGAAAAASRRGSGAYSASASSTCSTSGSAAPGGGGGGGDACRERGGPAAAADAQVRASACARVQLGAGGGGRSAARARRAVSRSRPVRRVISCCCGSRHARGSRGAGKRRRPALPSVPHSFASPSLFPAVDMYAGAGGGRGAALQPERVERVGQRRAAAAGPGRHAARRRLDLPHAGAPRGAALRGAHAHRGQAKRRRPHPQGTEALPGSCTRGGHTGHSSGPSRHRIGRASRQQGGARA